MNIRIADPTFEDAMKVVSICKNGDREKVAFSGMANLASVFTNKDCFVGIAEDSDSPLAAIVCQIHHGVLLSMQYSLVKDIEDPKCMDAVSGLVTRCLAKAKEMGAVRCTVGLEERQPNYHVMKNALDSNGFKTDQVIDVADIRRRALGALGIEEPEETIGSYDEYAERRDAPFKSYIMSISLTSQKEAFERLKECSAKWREDGTRPSDIDRQVDRGVIFGDL